MNRVPHWSEEVQTLWAKTDRSDPESTDWLNLPQHMLDSAMTGSYLWENYVPQGMRSFVEDQLNLGPDDCGRLVAFICGVHDIGKACPSFASQLNDSPRYSYLADRIRGAGIPLPLRLAKDEWVAHSTDGQVALTNYFRQRYGQVENLQLLYEIVGAHHGLPATGDSVCTAKGLIYIREKYEVWERLQAELIDGIKIFTGAEDALDSLVSQGMPSNNSVKMYLSGLVIMADWIASNTHYFPLKYCTCEEQADRFQGAIKRLRLPQAWSPGDFTGQPATDIYRTKFGWDGSLTPRPVQRAVLDILDQPDAPTMLIIEAPMGTGKTEAALIAAEKLAYDNGRNGVFFGAPTMATSNSLFTRTKKWAQKSSETPVISMYLGHSKNRLNPEFNSMRRYPTIVLDDEEQQDQTAQKATSSSQIIAHQWFRGRKQGILSSVVVGTVDQMLMMALQSKHLMLRHLGLAGKVVIIDEVHAYGTYSNQYLKAALQWLGSYGVPVVLLSATLPHSVKAQLATAYQSGLKSEWAEGPEEGIPSSGFAYPVITSVSKQEIQVHEIDDHTAEQTAYQLLPIDDDDHSLLRIMKRVEEDGGCLLVLCDTVDRAQKAYRLAKDLIGYDAYLLHSRFTAIERVIKEQQLVDELGPAASRAEGSRPHRRIVVATQVVEQSLDVDFDCMVTDIAPVDLLLQRMGRVHRHKRAEADRPEWAQEPLIYVRGMETGPNRDSYPVFSAGVDSIYESAILSATCAELGLHHSSQVEIKVPQDIPRLVQAVYSRPDAIPEAWAEQYEQARTTMEANHKDACHKASKFRASIPTRNSEFYKIWAEQEKDVSDARGAAQVRDTEPTIEVVLVQETNQGYYRPLPWLLEPDVRDSQEGIARGFTPDEDTAYLLAQSTVRLPYQLTRPWNIEKTLDYLEGKMEESWQQSPVLRGLLHLTLDHNNQAELTNDFSVQYTPEFGLEVTSLRKERKEDL